MWSRSTFISGTLVGAVLQIGEWFRLFLLRIPARPEEEQATPKSSSGKCPTPGKSRSKHL